MSLTIPAAGIAFNAEISGEAPSAVFIHGLESNLRSWDALFAELDGELPAFRYDRRGCGVTSDTSEDMFDHSEDLTALLDAAGIRRCSLVGLSKGGAIALNFALDHPDRVERLVLISPAIVAWEWSEDWKALWRPIADHARSGALDEARTLWWQHPLFDTVRSSEAGKGLFQTIMACSGSEWTAEREKRRLPDIDRLPMLSVPTLLLSGERDMPDFRLIADLIAGSSDRVRRVDVADAGHMLTLERPRLCAQEIRAFLG